MSISIRFTTKPLLLLLLVLLRVVDALDENGEFWAELGLLACRFFVIVAEL
jgi:hypothetical protein